MDLRMNVQPKRFLFLFSDTGGGHRASTQAVKDEFERLYGERAIIDMIDVFVEMEKWPFNRFPKWYPTVVGLNGIPWKFGFRLSDRVRTIKNMSRLVWPYAKPAFCQVLEQHTADVIVSFHPIPNYALFMARRQMHLSQPIGVVTLDLVTAHASWFIPGAEMYLVPTEGAKARALDCGVTPERLWITGMPTRRSFVESMTLSREEARAQLNLPQDQSIVLIVGGGEGMGPLAKVVQTIASRRPPAHLVAITGRNQDLADELRALDIPVPLQVEGFVSNMEVWMRAVDILVTKAGPNTLSEAFIAGLPLVLYTALPGQEEGNITHIVENHAGVWAPRAEQAADAVMHLLVNPSARHAMAVHSQSLAHPEATENIVRKLWILGDRVVKPVTYTDARWDSPLKRLFS